MRASSLGRCALGALGLVLGIAGSRALGACGPVTDTVDLGTFEGVRDLKLDENFYYCHVQPEAITPKRCAAGDAGDPAGGCHASKSSMILVQIDSPVKCDASGKPTGTVTPEERANYQAAQLRVTRDPTTAPILTRPLGQGSHPRAVFTGTSDPAYIVILKWIQGAR